ncbi:hypothetical protein [Solibacillus sp. FSL W8-0372]|uniref:hypothetical protein n=1 Tax=Solibacillus sp. FSL W8-0372 TaxID=2921713 RepID=UPI0030CCFB1E
MKEIIHFLMKGWLKSKYIFLFPIAMGLLVCILLGINSTQSGATKNELQETFDNREETVRLLISSMLTKDRVIGLTPDERESLDILLLKEEHIKEILAKISEGDLQIAQQQLAYINEYETYTATTKFIPYLNQDTLKLERLMAEHLLEYDLPYTEQITPYKTTLFTKQLFQIFFSPITIFMLLLVFCFKYMADKEKRLFDFFKINSLSNTSIYYGYLVPLLSIVFMYILIASILSFLPPLLTGNVNTIFYPLEVAVGSEMILVPVWKWLVFIPIGWGIFISFLLLITICLFKQQANLGVLFSIISMPVFISYMISLKTGFQIGNPIHLIASYEPHLLTSNRFVLYLLGMLLLLIFSSIIAYVIIRTKNIKFTVPQLNTTKKQYRSTQKFKLLQFEHLKKKRKGHILFTIILLFGMIGGVVIAVNEQYQTFPDKALKAIESYQNQIIQDQAHWKMVAEEFELEQALQQQMAEQAGEEMEILDENPFQLMIKQLENRYDAVESLKGEIHSPDFSETFRKVMKSLEPGSYKDSESTSTLTDMASEEQQMILEDKGITPWPLGHKWVSNFHDPSRAVDNDHFKRLKLFQEQNTKYDNSSLFAVYKFMDWNMMLFVLLLFVLLLWTTMAEERSPNPTINFLVTKPIRITSVYITKWLYNFVIACSLLLISSTIVFLVAILIGGLGEANYPILIYAKERIEEHFFLSTADNAYFYFESLAALLVKSGILIIAQIYFLNSLFSFIGKVMKNHYTAIIVTFLIVIAGYTAGNYYIELTSSFYNPFVYFDTWNVIDGWKSIEANNGRVNFISGTVILLISGSFLFVIGFLFRRRVAS